MAARRHLPDLPAHPSPTPTATASATCAGVGSHLDHLADLGVDAIWLSPFYPSPMADFGYDVADYSRRRPALRRPGGLRPPDRRGHARGIRVLIDWVPNHTSDRHPWFQASRSLARRPQARLVRLARRRARRRPAERLAARLPRRGQRLDPRPGHRPVVPALLHGRAARPQLGRTRTWRRRCSTTLRFWLDRGVDGFRIDVMHELGKVPDSPTRRGRGRATRTGRAAHEHRAPRSAA